MHLTRTTQCIFFAAIFCVRIYVSGQYCIMKAQLLHLVLALSFYLNFGQPNVKLTTIQDIRLNNTKNHYDNQGRVEILYNNTWGTICDDLWSTYDGRVACRMLGYSDVVCPIRNGEAGRAANEVPIWMSELRCAGTETYLDHCIFSGWGEGTHTCMSHDDDAGLVCRNESLLDIPEISVEKTTTRNIVVIVSMPTNWTIPIGARRYRFIVQYNTTTPIRSRTLYIYSPSNGMQREYKRSINYLTRDTEYSIAVRLDVSFLVCSSPYQYRYMPSYYSNPITVRTNRTAQESVFDVRLISPIEGVNYLGRVEVRYNDTWGTVCDSLDYNAANVICAMLNYRRAACTSRNARMGRGSGTIWLDRVRCTGAEIIDECSYNIWNTSSLSCSGSHRDDVGVICRPEPEDFLPAPEGFNITSGQVPSPTFTWKRYSFPVYLSSKRLILQYRRSDNIFSYSRSLPYASTTYTLTALPVGITVNVTIRPQGRLTRYYCYSYIDGASSKSLSISIEEGSPTGPPQFFHIAVVNCSAIRAEWDLPRYSLTNGIVRGYRLMILNPSGSEIAIDLSENITEYIIGGLEASTRYVVSVLAYTIGDGPRSIHLTATTNSKQICQTDIINLFGVHGDGIDKVTLYTYYSATGVDILCGSNLPGVEINWLFSNGEKVGIGNRDVHEGHFANGTSTLQFQRITLCDSGLYICRANQTTTGKVQQRTLKVKVNRGPPAPARPVRLNVTSTTITISWSVLPCNGGHDLQYFRLRYGQKNDLFFFFGFNYNYINSIDARQMNYTIAGLDVNTHYQISIRAEGVDNTYSRYSSAVTMTTLSPAPTPPRNVAVVLVTPDTILVTWIRSSEYSGRIVYYTVYATPFLSKSSLIPRAKRQTESLRTVAKNFTSLASSGNVTLSQQGVEYHIQVSVTVFDNVSAANRESELSALNPNAIIFVPVQGLPFPSSVNVTSSSNVSLTVAWDPPTTTGYIITGYLVEYIAMVEGRSPLGNLIRYMHEGSSITAGNATNVTVQPLIPQTKYLLKVAALTTNGEGMQVRVNGLTDNAALDFEQFAFFHVRFGPVLNCSGFRKEIEGQQSTVKEQILKSLNDKCNCSLTDLNIVTGFFSCGQKNHQIIYRAHILGTSNYSAIDLVDLLQSWVTSGRAYIKINSFRLQLDPTCPSQLDTLDDPECPVDEVTTSPKPTTSKPKITEPSAKTDKPSAKPVSGGVTAADIGGILVGVVIAILLLVVTIMLGILFCCWKERSSIFLSKMGGRTKFKDEDVTPFADLDQNNESNLFEEKLK